MSYNLYRRFLALVPGQPTDVGEVIALETDGVIIQLVSGELVRVKGTAVIGNWVYVRGGEISGPAPELMGEIVEI